MSVSIVVPTYNERDSITPLYEQLTGVLKSLGRPYEILFIDDGSRDDSGAILKRLAASDPCVKVVTFRRNYGQTAAMHAGLQMASCDVVITMDADLQNDPADIPLLLAKLDEGYDLVHGWRKNRQDAWLNRKLPSKIANWLISRVTGFPIHDLGCTLKAVRREIAREIELYGEMHRFIPILAHERGARCAEIVTRHHPRRFGTTKYGIGRTLRVVLDLVTVKFLIRYSASPMKLFGMIGLWCGLVSVLAGLATLAMKLFGQVDMTGNPLLILTVLSTMASLQFISIGLLGEVNARIYYTARKAENYAIRELLNFDQPQEVRPAKSRAA